MKVEWEPKVGPATVVGLISIVATILSVGVLWGTMTTRQDSLLDGVKSVVSTQEKFWNIVGSMDRNISEIKTSQATTTANFDAHLHSDDTFETTVKAAIADHENRLRLIQATTPPAKP